MARSKPTTEPTYEEQLARLVAIVAQLESGDLPLADALRLYEEGVALGAACQQVLDAAELRVQTLRASAAGPQLEVWRDE